MNTISRSSAASLRMAWAAIGWLMAVCGRARTLPARGQGLVEYALILVLVAIVVIGILSTVGARTSQVFDQASCSLSGGTYHVDHGNGNSNHCN
jgi:pilus assembly protein Flp/PilA